MAHDATDGDLLVRIGGGDADAFTLLWRRLCGPVIALGRRTLSDDQAAEDVAQETFATIWRAAGTYDAERGTASAWIFTIARNAARDVARRRRRLPPRFLGVHGRHEYQNDQPCVAGSSDRTCGS